MSDVLRECGVHYRPPTLFSKQQNAHEGQESAFASCSEKIFSTATDSVLLDIGCGIDCYSFPACISSTLDLCEKCQQGDVLF